MRIAFEWQSSSVSASALNFVMKGDLHQQHQKQMHQTVMSNEEEELPDVIARHDIPIPERI
jgi:hypothetical protein